MNIEDRIRTASNAVRTFKSDFEARKALEFEVESRKVIADRDEAIVEAIKSGVSKSAVLRAMGTKNRPTLYAILERYEDEFKIPDPADAITSEFDPDSNTVTVKADRLALTDDEYAAAPALNGEPVTLEATFDVSLLADGTPYYFPTDDDFTPLTVQFAKILPRYI